MEPSKPRSKSIADLDRLVDSVTPKHIIDTTTPYTRADVEAHPGVNRRYRDWGRWIPHQGAKEAARRLKRMKANG